MTDVTTGGWTNVIVVVATGGWEVTDNKTIIANTLEEIKSYCVYLMYPMWWLMVWGIFLHEVSL